MKRQNVLNKKKKKKGFTLIELIIVIAIIAILAVIAIPKFGEVRKNANASSDLANAKIIANSITTLAADGEIDLPASSSTTINIVTGGNAAEQAVADYMQTIPEPLYNSSAVKFVATLSHDGSVVVKDDKGAQSYPCKDIDTYKANVAASQQPASSVSP